MNYRVLTPEQLHEAAFLRTNKGLSKRKLAKYFEDQGIEVSATAIFENVLSSREKENMKRSLRVYIYKPRTKQICIPCGNCEMCMTKEFEDHQIPVNYQIGNVCITCYMESVGLSYRNLL